MSTWKKAPIIEDQKKDPITEISKKTQSLRNSKEDPTEDRITEASQEF